MGHSVCLASQPRAVFAVGPASDSHVVRDPVLSWGLSSSGVAFCCFPPRPCLT